MSKCTLIVTCSTPTAPHSASKPGAATSPTAGGVCQAHRPLKLGETVTLDHDLILWLTKDLTALLRP